MNSSSNVKKVFAKGLCFDKLFVIFVVSSLIGTIYEKLLTLVVQYKKTGNIVWPSRTAVIYGQFNMVYGFGAVLIVGLLCRNTMDPIKIVLYGSLIGGAFEYISSYLQELTLGTVSWNYKDRFLNIGGRTTIPYMFFWGILSLFVVNSLYPFISYNIEKIPYYIGKPLNIIMFIFLSLDIIISYIAVYRQTQRKNNIPPKTFIGRKCDEIYTDEYLLRVYPNMSLVKKTD